MAFSNLLFNIALEEAISKSCVQKNDTIIKRSHAPWRPADGIDLIRIDLTTVEQVYVPLKRETARIGLTIISTRTKYMIAGRDRGSPSYISAVVVIDGDVFEVVEKIYYPKILVTITLPMK